jgi:hypothetical protein
MTLKTCPLCDADVYVHCPSPACDLVTCSRCGHFGSLDGRWWGNGGAHFRRIRKVADELLGDVERSGDGDTL